MLNITIKTGKENMDLDMIHRFLTQDSYWAKGISYELVENSLSNSFCVGAFIDEKQIGFARVITDYSTFAYLADVLVLPQYQGKGVAKKMLSHIFQQTWIKRLRRIMLATKDAHELYRQFQFKDLKNPSNMLEIHNPDVYLQSSHDVAPPDLQ
jgi:N-acetylglutamate synthase-like GNAT family acetyltransferase